MYQLPGNVYKNTISAKEAEKRGCKPLEGAPITVIQMPKPRVVPAAATRSRRRLGPARSRVDPADAARARQRRAPHPRGELRTEEERLAALKKEFNNGEPERQGNEKNYQKYLDRVAEMSAAIARKESDIAAIKREIGKLPQ